MQRARFDVHFDSHTFLSINTALIITCMLCCFYPAQNLRSRMRIFFFVCVLFLSRRALFAMRACIACASASRMPTACCSSAPLDLVRPSSCLTVAALRANNNLTRYGSDYGGWYVDTTRFKGGSTVVYSVGLGLDISFDMWLLLRHKNMKVFGFDPTPASVKYVQRKIRRRKGGTKRFTHTIEAIGTAPGEATFATPAAGVSMQRACRNGKPSCNRNASSAFVTVPVNTLDAWMRRFGHNSIEVLKLDVESVEYDVLIDLLDRAERTGRPLPFRQLLVEFHPNLLAAESRYKHDLVVKRLFRSGYELKVVVGGMKEWRSRLRAALWGCMDVDGAMTEWTFVRPV